MEIKDDILARSSWLPRQARALVLFNENSGSVRAPDREKLLEQLQAAGVEEVTVLGVDQLDSVFARAGSADFILVLGGDGTARAIAALAPGDAPPLLLLPGGTLNLLPKSLYGDLAWPQALEAALAHGEVRRLTGGKANGESFFIAAMFGAPTLLAGAREGGSQRQGHGSDPPLPVLCPALLLPQDCGLPG